MRRQAFDGGKVACAFASRLIEGLRANACLPPIWCVHEGGYVHLDAHSIPVLVPHDPADVRGKPAVLRFPLAGSPAPGTLIGGLTLSLRADARGVPGFVLQLRGLPASLSEKADELASLGSALDVDVLAIGPHAIVQETGAGALMCVRRSREDVSSLPGRWRALGADHYFIGAHAESPESTSPHAVAAIRGIAERLGTATRAPRIRRAVRTADAAATAPAVFDVGVPSYLRAHPIAGPSVASSPSEATGEFGSGTAAMPAPSELLRIIAEAEPSVAIPRASALAGGGPSMGGRKAGPLSDEDAVGSGTVMAALPADLDRALRALPFAKNPAAAAPGEPRSEQSMSVNQAESRTPASAPGAVPFGSETAALPSPDEVRRLVAAAQPDAAIKSAAESASGAVVGARVEPDERRSQREENRTEAIDMDEVRRALVAFQSARSEASQPGVAIDTLASIAVAIRSGVPTNVAVARHGLTDDAWRTAQAAVVQDPVARARFEHAVERIRSAGR